MLPAEAVAADPVHASNELPPTAGPFRLTDVEAGLSATFEAHADGPLGPPLLASLEVLFTPSFETALGLLEDGDVDVVLGHLAVNPVARAREVEGVEAAAPPGGTLVSLEFTPDGPLGQPDDAGRRRAVGEAVAVGELVEGLLGPFGTVADSPWVGQERPPGVPAGELDAEVDVMLAYPRDHEVLGFAARIVQRDLLGRGVGTELVGRPSGDDTPVPEDVSLTVRRLPPRPALAPFVEDGSAEGGAPGPRDVAVEDPAPLPGRRRPRMASGGGRSAFLVAWPGPLERPRVAAPVRGCGAFAGGRTSGYPSAPTGPTRTSSGPVVTREWRNW